MGDYVDAINLSDPRFDLSQVADEVTDRKDFMNRMAQIQTDLALDILKPIKHKIIGLGVGNHELTLTKKYHYDVMYRLCGSLDVKYLGWTSLTRFRIKRGLSTAILNILSEHSRNAGRKKGSKVNALVDRSNDFDADIFLRGHSHDKLATTTVQIYLPKNGALGIKVRKRAYAICPSFYNAYAVGQTSYGEEAGYPPTTTGVVRLDVDIKKDGSNDFHIYQ